MILTWLRRWLFNRWRGIFRYWDGRRFRRIDPVLACRRLERDPEFLWDTHPALIDANDDDAVRITAAAVRRAFEIPEYDGKRGLTEIELVELLIEFSLYLGAIKKNTSTPPISPEPMARESSGVQSTTTRSSSDSGSTPTGPRPDEPAES